MQGLELARSTRACGSTAPTWRRWREARSSCSRTGEFGGGNGSEGGAEVADRILDFRVKLPTRNSRDEPQPEVPQEYLHYDEVYEGFLENLDVTLEDWVAEAEAHGVGTSVMQAEIEWIDCHEQNDRLAAAVKAHPDHVGWGFACVDPRDVMDAVREVDRAILDLGLHGIVFEPGFLGISPVDRRCYPVYARCSQLGVPVGLHTGINFSSHGPLEYERPFLIDHIARDFPGADDHLPPRRLALAARGRRRRLEAQERLSRVRRHRPPLPGARRRRGLGRHRPPDGHRPARAGALRDRLADDPL